MASTSHGHINIPMGIDIKKIGTRVSESNPSAVGRGGSKTSTAVFKSASFTLPSDADVFEDELWAYSGLKFTGSIYY